MDQITQLINLCITWRQLIQTKSKAYALIQDPLQRIRPALELIDLRIELALMEEELCGHLTFPIELYAGPCQKPT